jgi:Ni/Co efflux regulator RcnB
MQTGRRFGAGMGNPAGTPRTFGATATEPRRFGTAGGFSAGQDERHFGGGINGGEHGFRTAGLVPRRSGTGRQYSYHGRTYTRFAAGRYHWPRGYGYQRYAVGYHLPRAYWVRDYYIDNYADYDLGPPPDNYQWIRYGPDILLIDLDTGQIAQVVYGVFDEEDASADGGDGEQGSPDQPPPDNQY